MPEFAKTGANSPARHFRSLEPKRLDETYLRSGKNLEDVHILLARGDRHRTPDVLRGLLRNSSRITGADREWPACVFLEMKSDNISTNVPDSFSCDV